jgi:hypothetical protein
MQIRFIAVASGLLCWAASTCQGQTFEPVVLGGQANARLELSDPVGFGAPLPLSDPLLLASVPFHHPVSNWAWNSHLAAGGNGSASLMVPVASRPAIRAWTQLNTYWGIPGLTSLACIRFHFSNGTAQQYDLIGNYNIRDWNQSGWWTNHLTAPNATVGFLWAGTQRMDVQSWPVATPTGAQLVGIEFLDWGASNYSRIILGGVTLDLGPDSDSDGVADVEDNCPEHRNPTQEDCDANGFGDVCEIVSGSADMDGNGIPDTCECPGDLNQSGTVDAEDLSYVLFAWGTDGGKTPEADIDRSGIVNANDLSVVLGSWGPCP